MEQVSWWRFLPAVITLCDHCRASLPWNVVKHILIFPAFCTAMRPRSPSQCCDTQTELRPCERSAAGAQELQRAAGNGTAQNKEIRNNTCLGESRGDGNASRTLNLSVQKAALLGRRKQDQQPSV